jgi:hypothetical protein
MAASAAADPATMLPDGTRDRIVRRAFIPSDSRVHGEVRVVRRGDATVVQTLLFTSALRRGIQQMRKRELYHWPEGREGHEDSRSFLAELDRAADAVTRDAPTPAADPRRKLLIEVAVSSQSAQFALYAPEIVQTGREWTLGPVRLLAVRNVSRAWAERDQRLMAATAFHVPEAEAEAVLRAVDH